MTFFFSNKNFSSIFNCLFKCLCWYWKEHSYFLIKCYHLILLNTKQFIPLQVTYTSTNSIVDNNIYTVDSVDLITDQQIAMICSPFNIDIYLVSNNVLVHYAIDLPKVDGETLIGNYFWLYFCLKVLLWRKYDIVLI